MPGTTTTNQTPLKLARAIEAAGFRVLGTPFEAVDLAEDRRRFAALCDGLGIAVPPWGTATTADEAVEIAERIGYPLVVRPSYVLGGRSMRVCYDLSGTDFPKDFKAPKGTQLYLVGYRRQK